MPRKLILASMVAFVVLALSFPARAADTVTTITVLPGTLSISAPVVAVDLGSGTAGGLVSTPLGEVAVVDTRGSGGSWTATVSSSDFVSGANTIDKNAVSYWSGPATLETGTGGTATPGQLASADKQALSADRTAFSRVAPETGANTATWLPTLVVTIPPTALPGVYTGTVTHSVA